MTYQIQMQPRFSMMTIFRKISNHMQLLLIQKFRHTCCIPGCFRTSIDVNAFMNTNKFSIEYSYTKYPYHPQSITCTYWLNLFYGTPVFLSQTLHSIWLIKMKSFIYQFTLLVTLVPPIIILSIMLHAQLMRGEMFSR